METPEKPVSAAGAEETENLPHQAKVVAIVPTEPIVPVLVDAKKHLSLAPLTTAEEDLHTQGQRKINLIWEMTQAFIALSVVTTVLFVASQIALAVMIPAANEKTASLAATAFLLLSNLASLVIGFYFGRTNHERVGGVNKSR